MENNQEQCSVIGRLMSPHEAYTESLTRTDIPDENKHDWILAGAITQNIWTVLIANEEKIDLQLSLFTTLDNAKFACFAVQAGASQVRFLLRLGSKKIEWFLKDASFCGVNLLLSPANGRRHIVKKFVLESSQVEAVLQVAKQCRDVRGQDLVVDYSLAVLEARKLSAIASMFKGIDVDESHVIAA